MFKAVLIVAFVATVSAGPMKGGFSDGPMMMGPPGPGGPEGPRGPMGGPPGPIMGPRELENGLNEEQRQQLHEILRNDSATKQQTKDNLKSFFDGIGGNISTNFNEMQTQMESMKSEMEGKESEATANLSDAAKSLISQMKAIRENMSLTPAQERDQITALFDGASEEVKSELKSNTKLGPMGAPPPPPPPPQARFSHHHFTTVSA